MATDQQIESIRALVTQAQSTFERGNDQLAEEFKWLREQSGKMDDRLRDIEQDMAASARLAEDVRALAERVRTNEVRWAQLMGWAAGSGLAASLGFQAALWAAGVGQ